MLCAKPLDTGHLDVKYLNTKSTETVMTIPPEALPTEPNQPPRQIRIPETNSEDFAEFYGAMMGDGCIYGNMAAFCITCNGILDEWYLTQYLKKLCFSLFNIQPKIYYAKKEQVVRLIINSVKITRFLVKLGFPKGRKKDAKIRIPEAFFSDDKLLAACLRGLIDTDGGIYSHPHTKIMLDFTSVIPSLITSVHEAFSKLNLQHGISTNRIQFYSGTKLAKYFSRVGSSNPRNIIRYSQFIQTGITPSAIETERLLKHYDTRINVPYHGPVV
ncbi:LAGLIDADG-like domain protein [uncultured archaeon]|nr:LAGLIDADG-like domain protein [uncultured archaeon]